MANTLEGLCARGHQVTLVAPTDGSASVDEEVPSPLDGCSLVAVPVRRPPKLWHALQAQALRQPWTIVRHRPRELRRCLQQLLQRQTFDLVHGEQVQALGVLQQLDLGGLPLVWRAQNVESDLWRGEAASGSPLAPLLRLEASRLATFEGRAVAQADATLTLTREDGERLQQLAAPFLTAQEQGRGTLHHLPAPFEEPLPMAQRPLPGKPPLVLLGSGGWRPNRVGARWFLDEIWPGLLQKFGGARLHVFGDLLGPSGRQPNTSPSIQIVEPGWQSRDAFAEGSILIVPLQVASGVRMKILEAWARGVPVIATAVAARGLGAKDGQELFIADRPQDFERAVEALIEPRRRQTMVEAARRFLRRHHGLETIAERLEEIYQSVL